MMKVSKKCVADVFKTVISSYFCNLFRMEIINSYPINSIEVQFSCQLTEVD